ncbi:photosystem II biogenesis protein Psp29 [Leptolyngbya sp. 'hensonii']|uniref:photosystem II biogenesis protein Psp29 n=1 Tax=Leptolyngbya sp. 'hensonii' TaxID=1922337 RepID=UPI00094FBFF6|nr:photosystem II biogenesis protein Psp29 [Leptolyngbya sp. 'hensonii']OLP19349.1 photosystem II biogenesis protein Psp29 [Leptolyngbya sp. 'hensonii']
MTNARTVSDTKRAFYTLHTRPINSIYRRVVDELMVEMHLLSVNVDYRYDPIYALGVVSSFDRFMQFYRPEVDKASIFSALCRSLEADPQQYRQDAEQLQGLAKQLPIKDLILKFSQPDLLGEPAELREFLRGRVAQTTPFKYSRLFAIGLYSLLELSDPEATKEEAQRNALLKQFCEGLHLPEDKVTKDLELYRSNLEKIAQAQIVLEDILQADRKKREQRAQEKAGTTTPELAPDLPQDGAASGS